MSAENSVGINDFAIKTQNVVNETIGFADREKFEQWLGKGADFRVKEARFLAQELGDHQRNINNGSNRALVLLMAKMISLTGTWGRGEDHELLMNRLIKDLGGDDKAQQVIEEGFSEENGVWRLTGKPETDLADQVSEVVDEWFKKDSPQAREKKLKEELQVLAAQQNRIQAGAGESEDRADKLEESNKEFQDLAVAQTTHIEELRRKLRVAKEQKAQPVLTEGVEGEAAAREKAGKIYEALPAEIKEYIKTYIADSDRIQPIGNEVDEPENLAEKDRELLKKLRELDGFATRVLKELVFRETGSKELAFLPDILHLKLEERRIEQVKARERNRQIKDLRAHEPRIEITDGGMVIDESWKVISGKAKDLAVSLLSQDVKLGLTTGLADITNVEMLIDTDGKIKQTEIISRTLTENPDKDVVRSRLIILTADENQTGPIKLVKPKTQRENKFSIQTGEQRIGDVEIGKDGKLLIKWIDMELAVALDANVKLVNLLEHHLYGGEEGLKGLKLIMVRKNKAGAEVPAERSKREKSPAAEATPKPAAAEKTPELQKSGPGTGNL